MKINKQIHITNPDTILKLKSIELATGLKSPKIIEKALELYILEHCKKLNELATKQDIIKDFIKDSKKY